MQRLWRIFSDNQSQDKQLSTLVPNVANKTLPTDFAERLEKNNLSFNEWREILLCDNTEFTLEITGKNLYYRVLSNLDGNQKSRLLCQLYSGAPLFELQCRTIEHYNAKPSVMTANELHYAKLQLDGACRGFQAKSHSYEYMGDFILTPGKADCIPMQIAFYDVFTPKPRSAIVLPAWYQAIDFAVLDTKKKKVVKPWS